MKRLFLTALLLFAGSAQAAETPEGAVEFLDNCSKALNADYDGKSNSVYNANVAHCQSYIDGYLDSIRAGYFFSGKNKPICLPDRPIPYNEILLKMSEVGLMAAGTVDIAKASVRALMFQALTVAYPCDQVSS
jgi:hypothetical protein